MGIRGAARIVIRRRAVAGEQPKRTDVPPQPETSDAERMEALAQRMASKLISQQKRGNVATELHFENDLDFDRLVDDYVRWISRIEPMELPRSDSATPRDINFAVASVPPLYAFTTAPRDSAADKPELCFAEGYTDNTLVCIKREIAKDWEPNPGMRRITISIDDEMRGAYDELMDSRPLPLLRAVVGGMLRSLRSRKPKYRLRG